MPGLCVGKDFSPPKMPECKTWPVGCALENHDGGIVLWGGTTGL